MNHITIILTLILTVSCTNNSENRRLIKEIELSREQAVHIHDDVMERMGALNSLKKSLELELTNSLSMNNTDEIVDVITLLAEADKSMWDWMHNFNVAYANQNDSVTLEYYNRKLKEIGYVKSLFDTSMTRADKLSEN